MAGITLYEFIPYQFNYWLYIVTLLPLIIFILFVPRIIKLHHKKSFYLGIALQMFILITGYGNAQYKNRPKNITDLENATGVICRISQTPVGKTKSFKSEAFIEKALINDEWISIKQKMV